jgi:hypothetical protein
VEPVCWGGTPRVVANGQVRPTGWQLAHVGAQGTPVEIDGTVQSCKTVASGVVFALGVPI